MAMSEKAKNKDYSISFARLIAMCFIVACHMMQREGFASDVKGAHIEWAFWFNVGVQMFLFISGLLYGRKDKIDTVRFYKKSFPKLLVDYYMFAFAILAAARWIPMIAIDKTDMIELLTFSGLVSGLEHLWFVPTILFCYLLVPVFSAILHAIDRRSDFRFCVETGILLLIVHETVKCFFGAVTPGAINCFVLGMIYSKLQNRKTLRRLFPVAAAVLCLTMIPIQFRIDYWPHGELPGVFASRYSYFTQYAHVFLGIALVILIRFFYNKFCAKQRNFFVLNWSDKYSYDVYLVHHVFVQSAFACANFITDLRIALPLAVVLTIAASVLLNAVSNIMRNGCIAAYGKLPN